MSVLAERFPALASAPERIAVNGTTTPIDDEYGIPPAVFEGTLANFSETSLAKFERRMCRAPLNLAFYDSRRPKRSAESLKTELGAIREHAEKTANSQFQNRYTDAIIGIRDTIFPSRNQLAAWKKNPAVKIATSDSPHYSDAVLRNATCGGARIFNP